MWYRRLLLSLDVFELSDAPPAPFAPPGGKGEGAGEGSDIEFGSNTGEGNDDRGRSGGRDAEVEEMGGVGRGKEGSVREGILAENEFAAAGADDPDTLFVDVLIVGI